MQFRWPIRTATDGVRNAAGTVRQGCREIVRCHSRPWSRADTRFDSAWCHGRAYPTIPPPHDAGCAALIRPATAIDVTRRPDKPAARPVHPAVFAIRPAAAGAPDALRLSGLQRQSASPVGRINRSQGRCARRLSPSGQRRQVRRMRYRLSGLQRQSASPVGRINRPQGRCTRPTTSAYGERATGVSASSRPHRP